MKSCDCDLWLALPPGGHHEHCRGRFRAFDYFVVGLVVVAFGYVSVLTAMLVTMRSM